MNLTTSNENSTEGDNNETTDQPGNNAGELPATRNIQGCNTTSTVLCSLLDGDSSNLPASTGEIAKQLIEKSQSKFSENRIRVAMVGEKKVNDLDSKTIQHALSVSAALKARLQGLLQAKNLIRTFPSSHGKINKNRLHGLAVQDTKIFLQKTKQQATNTAIHILLDTSGSMRGKIGIANQACYSLAKTLENTKNINVGVTAFPAISSIVGSTPAGFRYAFLQPIVKHGEKVGNKFELQPEGGTPLAEALWWMFPQLLAQKEERKIILLITDGEPDNRDTTIHAIEYAKKIGIEIYGIGIPPCVVETLIHKSINLESIEQLPQAMFGLLQTALVGNF